MNKKSTFLVCTLWTLFIVSCSNPGTNKHIALWEAQNSFEEKMVLEFTENCFTFYDGISLVEGKYFIDYSKNPIWLDIKMADGEYEKLSKTIIEFIDKDRMKIYASFEEERPQRFDNDDRVIIFRKKK